MATDVTMPRLSDSMEEGTVLRWLVPVGGAVKRGAPLVEIETDKSNVTYEADSDGVLLEAVAAEGQTLAVGATIARIGDAAAPTPPSPGGVKGAPEVVEPSRLQRTVSRRMAESKATAPDFTLAVDVDMTLCVELRSRLERSAGEDALPAYHDMVVKAVGLAAREHPKANAAYRDGAFELYPAVNVGVTVTAQETQVVPVVRDADRKSLGEIARTTASLAASARDGSLTSPELAGATITVFSLGEQGIDRFTAILHPPQAAILAVGALAKRPAVDDHGRVVARDGLTITMTCDSRILHGADAAAFLAQVRELLEQPLALAL